jgi:predicted amidohydrolase YtcJ
MLLVLARDRPDVLRMKVVGKTLIRRRRIYRLELLKGGESLWSGSTDVPVNTIEPAVGMQEAWALTHEADRLWDNKLGEWVAFAIGPR